MNILLLGPQGSGKGTQARLLVEKFGFTYFESGAFLRDQSTKNEVLKKYLNEGRLVPDAEMSSYVTSYFDSLGVYDNILFDGFPRTLEQYKVFKDWLVEKNVRLDLVLVIEVSEQETVRRLSARRLDPKTGKIYNLVTDLPPAGVDESTLVQRDDDKPEAIKKRLSWYKDSVMPLVEKLKSEVRVVIINGERPIDVIQADLVNQIKSGMGNV